MQVPTAYSYRELSRRTIQGIILPIVICLISDIVHPSPRRVVPLVSHLGIAAFSARGRLQQPEIPVLARRLYLRQVPSQLRLRDYHTSSILHAGLPSDVSEVHNMTSVQSTPVAGQKRKRTQEKKYYAVKSGKTPGIYESWQECLDQIKGCKGAEFKSFPSSSEAQAYIDGKLNTTPSHSSEPKFYGVQNGAVPGVYTDWPSALAQISGFRNPKYKRFPTRAEAEAFVAGTKKTVTHDQSAGLNGEDAKRRRLVKETAPGLILNDTYSPKDKQGVPYDLARGPLPPGAEDGYDPNIKLDSNGQIVSRTEEEKSKTKTIPKEQDPGGMLRIYTDGSSLKNGQAGARAGIGVFFGPQDPKNISEALKGSKQTNQRAELTAILRALDIAPRHRDVTIYTDSKYSIECVTNWYKNWLKNGWVNSKGKSVENKDLVQDVREKMDERQMLGKATFFVWVKGHADDAGNIAADRLANEGALMG